MPHQRRLHPAPALRRAAQAARAGRGAGRTASRARPPRSPIGHQPRMATRRKSSLVTIRDARGGRVSKPLLWHQGRPPRGLRAPTPAPAQLPAWREDLCACSLKASTAAPHPRPVPAPHCRYVRGSGNRNRRRRASCMASGVRTAPGSVGMAEARRPCGPDCGRSRARSWARRSCKTSRFRKTE